MFRVTTNFNHALAGKGFFQKGITSAVTLEKGRLAYKAVAKLDPELDAFNQSVKAKVEDYNAKLMIEKKLNGEEGQISPELMLEKQALEKEIEEMKEQKFVIEFSDDQYQALCLVMEQAVPAIYKVVQKSNEGGLEKDEKAANINEFLWLQSFDEELKDAEKVKKSE